MADTAILGKAAVTMAVSAASFAALVREPWSSWSNERFSRTLLGVVAGSRLGLFLLVFVLLHMPPQSDVASYYVIDAQHAGAGELIYRDFPSSYGPAIVYLNALCMALWNSPRALIVEAIAWELLAVWLWLPALRRLFGEQTARRTLVLHALCPLAVINVAIGGQNQVCALAALGASVAWLTAEREMRSGVAAAFGALGIKLIAGLFAPVLFAAARQRLRWLAGFTLLFVVVLGALACAGANPLQPLVLQADLVTSGNLPYLLTSLGVPNEGAAGRLHVAILLASLGAVWLWVLRRMQRAQLCHVLTLVGLIFMLVSRKSYTQYVVLFLVPLCFVVVSELRGALRPALFALFSGFLTLEPSLWFKWYERRMTFGPPFANAGAWAFALGELVVVGGYVWLAWLALRGMRASATAGVPNREA
ncbi:MAG TPA: glycosyltransferase family 87 protein [Polyangiales bacterium]|nr:glycosyltransferase family 87 protein [Polyangiales bacterium]